MTSTRLELDQVAQGLFFWPVRALDRGLRHAGVRRAVKVAVDFCCGAAAVVTAVAVSEGIPTVGVAETASLSLLVGLVLVVADGLGGSYRAIWRYTSMREAITPGVSSGVVVGARLAGARGYEAGGWGGAVPPPPRAGVGGRGGRGGGPGTGARGGGVTAGFGRGGAAPRPGGGTLNGLRGAGPAAPAAHAAADGS